MAAPPVLTIRAELNNAVVVRPGDKLVFGTPNRLSQQDADTIKKMLAAKLPGVETVIISECSGLAVYRPDDEVGTPEARDAAARKAARIRGEQP